jgi:hypothetical protein
VNGTPLAEQNGTSALPVPLTPTVFFFARLGDMVMVTRMLNLLHRRYGRPCQVVGTGSWTPGTYSGNPDAAGVWAFHRHMMAAAEFRGDSDTIAHPRGWEFGGGSSVRFVPRSKGS